MVTDRVFLTQYNGRLIEVKLPLQGNPLTYSVFIQCHLKVQPLTAAPSNGSRKALAVARLCYAERGLFPSGKPEKEQGLLCWLFQEGVEVTSGTVEWYSSSYGTDVEI